MEPGIEKLKIELGKLNVQGFDGTINGFFKLLPNRCAIWIRTKTRRGYGQIMVNRKHFLVHRLFFEKIKGPILKGMQIDHLCKNKLCCNPEHLEQVTGKENNSRSESASAKNSKKTHCPRNHNFTIENTYVNPKNGQRRCRICERQKHEKRKLIVQCPKG